MSISLDNMMNRRRFNAIFTTAAVGSTAPVWATETKSALFQAAFAPHPGQLPTAPKGYLDQLKFAYDLGFRAWEDNGLIQRPAKLQQEVGDFCKEKGIALGVTVICGGQGLHFPSADQAGIDRVLGDMKKGVETSRRTGQTCMTMIPGVRRNTEELNSQIGATVDLMKRCCDEVEKHGIILVQEPLSHGVKGGSPLLRSFEDGYKLCQLVGRKSCKLLADFYHEGQIGNELLPNAKKTWSEVAYVQYGDAPGRKEPGSGKLDYIAVTKWLRENGYTGVIGMEHGVSAKGAKGLEKLLQSYREIDA